VLNRRSSPKDLVPIKGDPQAVLPHEVAYTSVSDISLRDKGAALARNRIHLIHTLIHGTQGVGRVSSAAASSGMLSTLSVASGNMARGSFLFMFFLPTHSPQRPVVAGHHGQRSVGVTAAGGHDDETADAEDDVDGHPEADDRNHGDALAEIARGGEAVSAMNHAVVVALEQW